MQHFLAAQARGRTQLAWLDSWHSFSFGEFVDPNRMGWGPLRVINEDWIAPGGGFGMHGHRDMEIITVVLAGALTHRDSLGHEAVLRPGEIQRMSAGTGIRHAELNASAETPVHLLQIWIAPAHIGTTPSYAEYVPKPAGRQGCLQAVCTPDGAQGLSVQQDVRVYVGSFEGAQHAMLALSPGRRAYVHLMRGQLTVGDQRLAAGDALALADATRLSFSAGQAAEVLVFDLP